MLLGSRDTPSPDKGVLGDAASGSSREMASGYLDTGESAGTQNIRETIPGSKKKKKVSF